MFISSLDLIILTSYAYFFTLCAFLQHPVHVMLNSSLKFGVEIPLYIFQFKNIMYVTKITDWSNTVRPTGNRSTFDHSTAL